MHHTYAFLLSRNDFDISWSPGELGRQSVNWVEKEFLEGSDYLYCPIFQSDLSAYDEELSRGIVPMERISHGTAI